MAKGSRRCCRGRFMKKREHHGIVRNTNRSAGRSSKRDVLFYVSYSCGVCGREELA